MLPRFSVQEVSLNGSLATNTWSTPVLVAATNTVYLYDIGANGDTVKTWVVVDIESVDYSK